MKSVECEVVQDLLALYAEGEVSLGTRKFVEQHLEKCEECSGALEGFIRPVFPRPVAVVSDMPAAGPREFLLKLRRAVITAAVIVLTAGISLASASYYAGRHIAMRDPSYDVARQKGLFTEINKAQKLGDMNIVLDQVLFDTTRTTVFYRVEPGLEDGAELEMEMKGSSGTVYNSRSTRGFDGKMFVAELEPVQLDEAEVEIAFKQEQVPVPAVFKLAVDHVKIAEATREIRPKLQKVIDGLKLEIDKVNLGVSSTQVDFRVNWDRDKGIRGIGFATERPIGAVMGDNGPKSAESRFTNFRPVPEGTPTAGRTALIDTEDRREVQLTGRRLETDSLSGGIKGAFTFAPVDEKTGSLKLVMAPVYVYRHVQAPAVKAGETINLEGVKLAVESIEKTEKQVVLTCTIPAEYSNGMPVYLPEFVIVGKEHPAVERPGDITLTGNRAIVRFRLDAPGDEWEIRLKSLGKLLSEDFSFNIQVYDM